MGKDPSWSTPTGSGSWLKSSSSHSELLTRSSRDDFHLLRAVRGNRDVCRFRTLLWLDAFLPFPFHFFPQPRLASFRAFPREPGRSRFPTRAGARVLPETRRARGWASKKQKLQF